MPGIFDGIRVGLKGTLAHRKMVEITSNNIANASNEDYSRQQAKLTTVGTVYEGSLPFGQGSEVQRIVRIRDELLDAQVRATSSTTSVFKTELKWLQKIESLYNEPSDSGINKALSDFWEAWSELSTDPENFATRSNAIAKTENLSELIRNVDKKLVDFIEEITVEKEQLITEINAFAKEIAELNRDIFRLEAGGDNQANDLRDMRDAAVGELANLVEVNVKESKNGMFNILVGQHYLVFHDKEEELKSRVNPLDASLRQVIWKNGDSEFEPNGGDIAGIIKVSETTIPEVRSDLNVFVDTLIKEVNKIYSNGVSLEPKTRIESRLGYEALGVTNSTTALNLVTSGSNGSIHVSFYDSSGKTIRSHGIVVDSGDSLDDIAQKLNGIRGLDAAVLSSNINDGKLALSLDVVSGSNSLGETSFAVSDNTGGFDTTGFLNLLGFSQTAKSTNTSSTAPTLTSVDLSTLQTTLGEPDVASVRSHALNMSGSFTINAFETGTESTGFTNGFHVQQLTVNVASTDTIDSVIAKVNAFTTNYGISMSVNASNQVELTSTAGTDSEGNLVAAGSTNNVRLSFANTYQYPSVSTDTPPTNFDGKGDNTGVLASLQFNTLFQGSTASDIALDGFITSSDKINAGYKNADGDNSMTLDMASLQHQKVAIDNTFTINEHYHNIVSEIGTDVQKVDNLANNEDLVLQSFLNAREQISGVNLDEELANMIIYQRSYEANARMIRTINEMIQEFLEIR